MKILFLILTFQLANFISTAQIATIELDGYRREFYIGLKNYLFASVENCPCKLVKITASRGKITGDSCLFVYETDTASHFIKGEYDYPKELPHTELKIYRKVGRKSILVRNAFYQLKFVPDPVALLGGHGNGDTVTAVQEFHSSNFMVLRSEVRAILPMDVRFRVQNFKVSIIRGDSTLLNNFVNTGNWFSNELITEFRKLKFGDHVKFYDIFTKGSDGTYRLIAPITLILNDRFKRGSS
ncbi:MAG: GldM family protein [Ferruginibacter sp.]